MDINAMTITDEEADALAQVFRLQSYTDGNDLIAQCVTAALLQIQKQNLIKSILDSKDITPLNTVVEAWNSVAVTPVEPISGKVVPVTPVSPIKTKIHRVG